MFIVEQLSQVLMNDWYNRSTLETHLLLHRGPSIANSSHSGVVELMFVAAFILRP